MSFKRTDSKVSLKELGLVWRKKKSRKMLIEFVRYKRKEFIPEITETFQAGKLINNIFR